MNEGWVTYFGSRDPGIGCSTVTLIQLSMVELAQMATASMTTEPMVNQGFFAIAVRPSERPEAILP
jgi:hypothetical protein